MQMRAISDERKVNKPAHLSSRFTPGNQGLKNARYQLVSLSLSLSLYAIRGIKGTQ